MFHQIRQEPPRFIYGRAARYEVYGDDAYADLIDPELPDFVCRAFERLCQHAILYEYGDEYRFVEEPGNWWDGSGHEIDVVAPTNGRTLLVGEAKFQQSEVGYEVLSQLRDEAQLVDWTPDGGGECEYEFALFSRTGFSQSVEEATTKLDTLRLFTVDEVVRLVTS